MPLRHPSARQPTLMLAPSLFSSALEVAPTRALARTTGAVAGPKTRLASARYLSSSSPRAAISKIWPGTAAEAVQDIPSGSTVLSSGFGLCGTPFTLLNALAARQDLKDLTVVSNNAGLGDQGVGALVAKNRVKRLVCSFLGANKFVESQYLSGQLQIELTPQGSIAEKARAGAFGIPAFYTPTGTGTLIAQGGLPVQYGARDPISKNTPEAVVVQEAKEVRDFDGRPYLLERAIRGDVAVIHAWKADEQGNCVFRYAAGNFAPLFGKNAKLTIVEVEEIVRTGEIDPNQVQLPSVYVDRIVKATEPKQIEKLTVSDAGTSGTSPPDPRRALIAKRAAKEFRNGYTINLGVGIPTLSLSFLDPSIDVTVHSENGILGMGPYPSTPMVDADIVNAGKETVLLNLGASTFDSAESFGMVRGGHIDVTMLGALQVGANGDLANFFIPGKTVKGMGGAMDLCSSPDQTRVVVLTDHVDKWGKPKIVQHTSLPLTGRQVASRIITDLAVFDVDRTNPSGGLTLVELQPGATLEQVKEKTGAPFNVDL